MKKTLLFLLVMLAAAGAVSSAFALEPDVFRAGKLLYKLDEDGAAIIVGSVNLRGKLEIPSEVDGYPVIAIAERAFDGVPLLTNVTIPAGIRSIGDRAFYDAQLESLTLPEGVSSIGAEAFAYSDRMASVTLPESLYDLGSRAFMGCSKLTRIDLPNGIGKIGDNPFAWCGSLTWIGVDSNHPLLRFENGVLYAWPENRLVSYLLSPSASFDVPQGTRIIGGSAFFHNYLLRSITIPDSVVEIGDLAFAECSDLESIFLPASVTRVGANPFSLCMNLAAGRRPVSAFTRRTSSRMEKVSRAPGST